MRFRRCNNLTVGDERRLMSPSYSVCIFVRRFESRSTSAEISTISASGRYASNPSLATTWTDLLASPEDKHHFILNYKLNCVMWDISRIKACNLPGGDSVKLTFCKSSLDRRPKTSFSFCIHQLRQNTNSILLFLCAISVYRNEQLTEI